MAINSDIRDQAYQFFIEEAPDLLHLIETGLLTLNQDRSTAKIHSLMRSAHSLKGGAAGVGLDAIATLAHRLENIFKALYNETLATDSILESWLLQAYDCLRSPLMQQITTGDFDAMQALATAEPIFSQIEAYCGEALTQADSYIPSSAEMGVDMIRSIFEVDVVQGLEQIASALTQPQADIFSELQIQAEVFAGFAEVLNLPGFGTIAQVVQEALRLHPEQADAIAQLALIEFEQSRQAVLTGDRTGGPAPSAALMRFIAAEIDQTVPSTFLSVYPSLDLNSAPEPESNQLAPAQSDWQPTEVFFGEDIFFEEAECPDEEQRDQDWDSIEMTDDSTNVVDQSEAVEAERFTLPIAYLETSHEADVTERLMLNENDAFVELAAENSDFREGYLPNSEDELRLQWVDDTHPDILNNLPDESLAGITHADILNDLPDKSLAHPIGPTQQNDHSSELEQESFDRSANPDKNLGSMLRSNFQRTFTSPQSVPSSSVANLTVRVDSERLERMNNLVGELAISRSSLSLQNEQLQRVIRELRNRFARFQTMVSRLQNLSDQINVLDQIFAVPDGAESDSNPEQQQDSDQLPRFDVARIDSTAIAFDVLEMDRYGATHSQLQAMLEDLVQLEESVDDIALFTRQSNQTLGQQQHKLTQLRDELVWARMLPLTEVLNRFPRILRDLSVTYEKPVNLKLTGAEVLIDRAILEKLYDPLLHLLRNAFDHGIESPQLRQQAGKSEQGQIEIRAFHRGNQTIIEVHDDGQGLDLDRIRERVEQVGGLSKEQVETLAPTQLIELIFEPGFSTAAQVSELSGRGFGLDVVRSQLQALRGTVNVSSMPGQGTTFTLTLPLTLAITQLIVCSVGSLPIALPADSIEDILVPQTDQWHQSNTHRSLAWRGKEIPVYPFADLLQYTCPISESIVTQISATFPAPQDWDSPIVVIRRDQQVFGLAIDRVITEQELVIKPFAPVPASPNYLYGCTILGDGSPVPVVDAAALLAWTFEGVEGTASEPASFPALVEMVRHSPPTPQNTQISTVLVVDDSIMLRRTLALFLEREGFRVLQAQDGQEAINQLRHSSVQLVVCDIEMPNMNGFEFLNVRRQDPHLAAIPVMILTSRSNEKHRWLAVQLGAADYMTKPYLEQQFLTALKALLK